MALELRLTAKDESAGELSKFEGRIKKVTSETAKLGAESAKTHAKQSAWTKDVGGGLEKIIKQYTGLSGGMIGVALAAGKVAVEFKQAIFMTANYRDEMGELSQATGVSTDALVNFQYAAKRNGLEIGDVGTAVSRLTKLVGDAASGNEEAVRTFENLGVSIRDDNGQLRNMEPILLETARQITSVKNSTDKGNYAIDAFGKTGIKFLNTLSMLSTQYDDINEKTTAFGLHFSEAERRQAEEYTDTLQDMKDMFSGIKMELVSGAIPALTNFMEGYLEYVRISKDPDYMRRKEQETDLLFQQSEIFRGLVAQGRMAEALKLPWITGGLDAAKKRAGGKPAPYGTGTDKTETAEEPDRVYAPGQYEHELNRARIYEDFAAESEIAKQRQEQIKKTEEMHAQYGEWAANVILAAEDDIVKKAEEWDETSARIANTLSTDITNSLLDIIIYGEDAAETFKNLGQSILSNVVGALIQAALQATMLKGLRSIMGGVPEPGTFKGDFYAAMAHQGGIIGSPRIYHYGGLAPDEVNAKLRKGEGVISTDSMKKLGPEGFERARRGQSGGGGNTININTPMVDESWVRFNLMPIIDRINRKAG